MEKISKYILLQLVVLVVFCTSCEKPLVRRDLFGKPLESGDFSFIVDNHKYPAFDSKKSVETYFPEGVWEKRKVFLSSENPDMPGRADLPTEEYSTKDVRFVFFEGIHKEVRKEKNGFTSIRNGAMTIRGVSVGDTIDSVFDVYGKTDWVNEHEQSWYTGWLGFQYKLFYDSVLMGDKVKLYDSIKFEIQDGIVVGIYYSFMKSDEI